MFFLQHAPHIALQARTVRSRIHEGATLFYEVALQPAPQQQAVFKAMSKIIHDQKRKTVTERRLMHEHLSSLLFGNGAPPSGMDESLAVYTESLLCAQLSHYNKLHPFRTKTQAVA